MSAPAEKNGMNSEQLIELTKELIYEATHFNVPYVEQIYADKLLIIEVAEDRHTVNTMNKEQLLTFVTGNRDAGIAPLSSNTEFHYAVCEENMGVVVMTRELELNGKWGKKFFTLIWEYSSGKWQVVKESYLALN